METYLSMIMLFAADVVNKNLKFYSFYKLYLQMFHVYALELKSNLDNCLV